MFDYFHVMTTAVQHNGRTHQLVTLLCHILCKLYTKNWYVVWLYHIVMCPKDADRMTNSVVPGQTAPSGPVWSGSTLFETSIPFYPKTSVITVHMYFYYRDYKELVEAGVLHELTGTIHGHQDKVKGTKHYVTPTGCSSLVKHYINKAGN